MAVNFSAVLRDIRAAERDESYMRRPLMTETAVVYAGEQIARLRGLYGDDLQEEAASEMLDWMNGAGYGYAEFRELLRAVAEEDIVAARDALDRAVNAVARYMVEVKGL